jgi:glycosyltransferase involved in cell wall biosynthesis
MRAGLFAPGHEPDIFTFQAAHGLLPPELRARIVRTSRLARLPAIRQRGQDPGRWRYLLPHMPGYFRRLDLDRYDLVISSSHACAVNVRPREDALHVCYCYTPMRYAWMPETDSARVGGLAGVALGALRGRLRRLDLDASRRPDVYIAISESVRDRIRRFYGRDALVIHPPVDIEEFDPASPKERGRFLWVNRLVSYKRPLEVVEAFRGLPYRLTMVGVGPLEPILRRALPPNVRLLGWVSRGELARLYSAASGFVHVGEEDFGISMVEALAAGAPVVALDRGGARDIVRHDLDGVLVPEPDPDLIRAALTEVATRDWDRGSLAARAREFSRVRFVGRLASCLADLGVGPAASPVGAAER